MATYEQIFTKQELRARAIEKRKMADFASLNPQVIENIKNSEIYKFSKNVMIFYPLENEINLLELLSDDKNFSFPCVFDTEILPYKNGGEFKKGAFGIFEPAGTKKQDTDELDLVIIPALCADKNGYRIGYGKGYYDRFIKTLNRKRTKLLTPIFSEFVVDTVFAEPFDEKVDFIATEKRVIKVS